MINYILIFNLKITAFKFTYTLTGYVPELNIPQMSNVQISQTPDVVNCFANSRCD